MTIIKPLQAICSQGACRRRQVVPADRIWYIDVRKGPGSHREAGWTCRFCGKENATPPSHLPRGTIAVLPSRQQVLDRQEPTRVPERKEVAQDRSVPAPSKQGTMARPSTAGPDEMYIPTHRTDLAIGTRAISTSARGDEEGAIPAGPIDPIGTDGRDLLEIDQADRSNPTWVVGRPAKAALIEALSRIACHGGHAIAITTGRHGFDGVDVRVPDKKKSDDAEVVAAADFLLDDLERRRADVLILGGSVRGRPWQAIMHVRAGATSFV